MELFDSNDAINDSNYSLAESASDARSKKRTISAGNSHDMSAEAFYSQNNKVSRVLLNLAVNLLKGSQ